LLYVRRSFRSGNDLKPGLVIHERSIRRTDSTQRRKFTSVLDVGLLMVTIWLEHV